MMNRLQIPCSVPSHKRPVLDVKVAIHAARDEPVQANSDCIDPLWLEALSYVSILATSGYVHEHQFMINRCICASGPQFF